MTGPAVPAKGSRATMRDWDGSRLTGTVEAVYTTPRRRTTTVALRVNTGDALGSHLRHLPLSHWVRR